MGTITDTKNKKVSAKSRSKKEALKSALCKWDSFSNTKCSRSAFDSLSSNCKNAKCLK